MKKIKYIFKDAFAPHVGTCTCANLLQDALIRDGSNIRVHWYTTPLYKSDYRKNKIYEMDKDGNTIFIDTATKLLQKKVHPDKGEEFGLYYVYTYDEIPTDEQLSKSFLVYVCCEEVEFKETVTKLPPGKSKNVQWQSSNKGGGVKLNPNKVTDTKFPGPRHYKKIEESGFTHLNKPKKDIKPSIVDIRKNNDEV